MENIATSVRITGSANALLTDLVSKTGKSKAQIVEEALRDWEERIFWTEVRSAFAEPEPEDLRAERELWETTVADGIKQEHASQWRRGTTRSSKAKR